MSVGRVVVDGLLGSKEDNFFVHMLDQENAAFILESKPPGYAFLRVERNNNTKNSVLIASFKYKTVIVHHKFPHVNVKVTTTSGSMLKCKINSKNYKYLRKIGTEFFPTLRLFITEFVSNHNFIETTDEAILDSELLYRKFIIFPDKDRIILRKFDKEVVSASIGFDFEELSFFAESENQRIPIKSFNEYLIPVFLKINFSDKLLVRHALGYQRDVDLYTGVSKGSLKSRGSDKSIDYSSTPTVATEDREKLIQRLSELLQQKDEKTQTEIKQILISILKSVKAIHSEEEKELWVNSGILNLVFKIILNNGNGDDMYNVIPIKIGKHLINDNINACKILGNNYLSIISGEFDWECLGIFQSLYVFVGIKPFRDLFVQHLGVTRLLQVYGKASVILRGTLTNSFGEISNVKNQQTTILSPPSHPKKAKKQKASKQKYKNQQPATTTTSVGGFTGRRGTSPPPISSPLLISPTTSGSPSIDTPLHNIINEKIPSYDDDPSDSSDRNNIVGSSSSRLVGSEDSIERGIGDESGGLSTGISMNMTGSTSSTSGYDELKSPTGGSSSGGGPSKPLIPKLVIPTQQKTTKLALNTDSEFQVGSSEELIALAKNLGESYMTSDLTALLSFIQHDTGVKARKERVSITIADLNTFDNDFNSKGAVNSNPGITNSCYYKIKSWILRTLSKLTSYWECLAFIPNPVNFLYSELSVTNRDGLLNRDVDFNLIYSVLANYASYTESIHRNKWNNLCSFMDDDRKYSFRRKADKFIWRLYNRLSPSVEAMEITEIETQLKLLADYLINCSTTIVANQVADVCMETLIKIKDFIFMKGHHSINHEYLIIIHRLMEVFDELILLSNHEPLDSFLTLFLLEKNEIWKFFKYYSCQVLLSKAMEYTILHTKDKDNNKQVTSQLSTSNSLNSIHANVLHSNINNQPISSRYNKQQLYQFPASAASLPQAQQGSTYVSQHNASPQPLNQQQLQHSHLLKNLDEKDKEKINLFKQQVIRHYFCCLTLIQRQLKFYRKEIKNKQPHSAALKESILELLKNFEFLIHPTQGCLLQILNELKGTIIHASLQKEILKFLISIFSMKDCIFLKNKSYIDSLISYAYLAFIKLYHSVHEDSDTFDLISLHLQLLLAFSSNKNEKIILKFYQLRVIDFLVGQVSLEYEITKTNYKQHLQTSQSSTTTSTVSSLSTSASSPNLAGSTLSTVSSLSLPTANLSSNSSTQQQSQLSPSNSINENNQTNTNDVNNSKIPFLLNLDAIPSKIVNKPTTAGQSVALSSGNSNPTSTNTLDATSADFATSSDETNPSTPHAGPVELKKDLFKLNIPPEIKKDSIKINIPAEAKKDAIKLNIPPEAKKGADKKVEINKLALPSVDKKEKSNESIPTENVNKNNQQQGKAGGGDNSETTEEEEESEYSSSYTNTTSATESTEATESTSSAKKPAKAKISMAIPSLQNIPTKGGSNPAPPGLALPAAPGGNTNNNPANSTATSLSLPSLGNHDQRGALEMEDNLPLGNLSKLEKKINTEDPKWQLIFEKKNIRPSENVQDLSNVQKQEINNLYSTERQNQKIYSSPNIQISILQLIISLMLSPSNTLEPLYSDQFPLDNNKLNIPFLVRQHLNHPANSSILPRLVTETIKMGRNEFRLLKLLSTKLFQPDNYNDLHRIATGAYGTVYRTTLKPESQKQTVAIKLMEVPKSIHDRNVLHGIFDEVLVLDKFKDDSRISHAYDFGTDDDYYWITMKNYKCSLKFWRQKQTAPLKENLILYLNIYMNILNNFQFLVENSVNHFDVKCDNFLIQPLSDSETLTPEEEEDFWHPKSNIPKFSICLADFGEAKVYTDEINGYTTRNRGTEFTKSPEMLAVAYASQKTRSTYDRRKKVGASSPSDIWSLGCLLYELLTGEFLFYDQDWVRFFIRVTSLGQELITAEKIEKIDNIQLLVEFLNFILTRDPHMRPSIHDVIQRFKYVRGRLTQSFANAASDSLSNQNHDVNNAKQNAKKGSNPNESASDKISQKNYQQITTSDYQYFMHNESSITSYLFISPYSIIHRKKLNKGLGITHLVICTGTANALLSQQYSILHLNLDKNTDKSSLYDKLPEIINFINDARSRHGKVAVCCDNGINCSAAVTIGYLMSANHWSYFKALIYVKERRYIIDPDEQYINELVNYHFQSLNTKNVKQYQCICGACAITVISPFTKTIKCSCKPTAKSDCPNLSCSEFLRKMKEIFNYSAGHVEWGYTKKSLIRGDYYRYARQYDPRKESEVVTDSVEKKEWDLFRCRSCDFITYAVNNSYECADPGFVVVLNLPVADSSSI